MQKHPKLYETLLSQPRNQFLHILNFGSNLLGLGQDHDTIEVAELGFDGLC